MILGTGVDIIEISRILALHEKQGQDFLARCFTDDEAAYCQRKKNMAESLAARFAAKEAVMKALGSGWSGGVGFRNIELVRADEGAPQIRLHGAAAEYAKKRGITRIHISVSHCKEYAVAFAVAEGDNAGGCACSGDENGGDRGGVNA